MVYGFRIISKELYYSLWGYESFEEAEKDLEKVILKETKREIFEKKGRKMKLLITKPSRREFPESL